MRLSSTSQWRSKIRQAQQRQQRAIQEYNRRVREHNRSIERSVSEYNRQVRAYNARVRAHRQRLANEIRRLQQRRVTTRYVTLKTSFESVHATHVRLENAASRGALGPQYDDVLELSEREAANSAAVMNTLLDGASSPEGKYSVDTNSLATPILAKVSQDYAHRWSGALFALNPNNPDAARHFCASSREILTEILATNARDDQVIAVFPNCDLTPQGRPTRRSKIRYFLHKKGLTSDDLEEFVEADMKDVVELFDVLNQGTHGPAGTFDMEQLMAMRKRVEDNILFLMDLLN